MCDILYIIQYSIRGIIEYMYCTDYDEYVYP